MTAFEFQNQLLSLDGFINRFALKFTGNKEDAKDLAQETLLKAISNYDKFRTNTNLKGWVRVIMRNIFINAYRRNSTYLVKYDSESYIVQQGETDYYSPECIINKQLLDKAVSELQDEFRIPFEMHVSGFKYHEIAEQMNLPIGTVKSRIFQARKNLSEKLGNA